MDALQREGRKLLVHLFVALIGVSAMSCCSPFYRKEVDSSLVVVASKEFQPIPFTLLKKPKVKRAIRGPLPDAGATWLFGPFEREASYRYKGWISFEDKRAKLDSRHHPIALVRHRGDIFLICENYFDKGLVVFYSYDKHKAFRRVKYGYEPPVFWHLRFRDHDRLAQYRVSRLLGFADNHMTRAFEIFSEYVKSDPRFCHVENWQVSRHRTGIGDFFLENVVGQERFEFYPGLKTVLEHSAPHDDPQELHFMFYALYRLKPEETRPFLIELRAKFEKEQVPGDERLQALDSVDISLKAVFEKPIFEKP